jgi:hypothetical protein
MVHSQASRCGTSVEPTLRVDVLAVKDFPNVIFKNPYCCASHTGLPVLPVFQQLTYVAVKPDFCTWSW